MQGAWLFVSATLLVAAPAQAGGPYPTVPPEIGVAPFLGPSWDAYRCVGRPVTNFYHAAYYGEEPPALYRGYAHRPHNATAPIADIRAPISASRTEYALPRGHGGRQAADKSVPVFPF